MGASGSSSERGVLGPRALDPVVPNLLFSVTQIVLHVCLPQLLVQLVCKEMGLTGLECDSAAVSGQASIVSLYSSVLIAVPGLFIVGFYGKFADYYGLKMTLLCPVVGNFLFLACMCWALLHPEHYFPILMLGSVISGFSGSRNAFIMASFTYGAEKSTAADRSEVFSMIESGIYTARIVGPFIVGELAKRCGFVVAVGVGMAICVVDFVFILLAMEHFLPSKGSGGGGGPSNITATGTERAKLTATDAGGAAGPESPFVLDPLVTFRRVGLLFGAGDAATAMALRPEVPFLAVAYFVFYTATTGEILFEILFQKKAFHFTAEGIGFYGSTSGVMMVLSMVVLPRALVRLVGRPLPDLAWVEVGLWTRAAYYVLFSQATAWWQLFFLLALILPSGTIVPRARSYLSKTAPPGAQTSIFVAIAALEAIAALLSPLFSAGYAATVAYAPGLMFLVIAACCVVSSTMVLYVRMRFGVLGDDEEEVGKGSEGGKEAALQGRGRGMAQAGYKAIDDDDDTRRGVASKQ